MPRVAIVTPAHNGVTRTLRLLASVEGSQFDDANAVLVDDGSTDGTAEIVAREFPRATVLKGDGTLWWSGSTNLGTAYAREHGFDYVLTINSDAALHADAVTRLVATAEANPKSIVGAKVLTMADPSVVWFCGASLDTKTGSVIHQRGRATDFAGVAESQLLTGMGMLIPVDAFEAVGEFDRRRLPQYFADMDFALRAKERGYRLLVDADAVVYCDTGSSWIADAREKPRILFPFELLLRWRSPENVAHYYRFVKRHWPTRRRRVALRHYAGVIKNEVLRDFVPRYLSGVAARVRRRP